MSNQLPDADLDRLREEYARRRERQAGQSLHSLFSPGDLFIIQSRQRELIALLRREGFFPLTEKKILEIGCGSGGVLREFLSLGATPENLHGIELLPWRVEEARQLSPNLPLINADGRELPYPDEAFDVVMQFTVFSSILSDEVRHAIAAEMQRVLRPEGLIIWYDFWLNPTNQQTRGVRPAEIKSLFPNSRLSLRRITLAPPITRRLAPFSWLSCYLLERLQIINTHFLGAIRKSDQQSAVSYSGQLQRFSIDWKAL